MTRHNRILTRFLVLCSVLALTLMGVGTTRGSDHADVRVTMGVGRNDVGLTDLHTYIRGDNLVLSLTGDPAVPNTATSYVFPTDLVLRINIDNDSEVVFDEGGAPFGGTIVNPEQIREDIVFQITFNEQNAPQLKIEGSLGGGDVAIQMYAGLRDDPFTPFRGKNVWAVVLELPLSQVIKSQPTLLIWATSEAPGMDGPIKDLAGRALRSQTIRALNTLHPSQHTTVMEAMGRPDVIIFDTSKPTLFPNGRELVDDVQRIVANNPANPPRPPNEVNDKAFLETFPYLATPWPPPMQ